MYRTASLSLSFFLSFSPFCLSFRFHALSPRSAVAPPVSFPFLFPFSRPLFARVSRRSLAPTCLRTCLAVRSSAHFAFFPTVRDYSRYFNNCAIPPRSRITRYVFPLRLNGLSLPITLQRQLYHELTMRLPFSLSLSLLSFILSLTAGILNYLIPRPESGWRSTRKADF